jgi:hypothetical protein
VGEVTSGGDIPEMFTEFKLAGFTEELFVCTDVMK